jgi:hypothetical protein
MTLQTEVLVDVGVDKGGLIKVFISLILSIARFSRRNGRCEFSTRLLAQRPISCLSLLPSSFMAALYERSPSVVITSGDPWYLLEGKCRLLVTGS